jgi:hypothetical protein
LIVAKRNLGVNNGNWQGGDKRDKRATGKAAPDPTEIEDGQTKFFLEREREWMRMCAEVEGAPAFLAWYDNNDNVPARGQASARILLIQAHYEALKVTHADAFYWLGVEKQEAINCIQIEGRESFVAWWNDDANFPNDPTPKERVEMIRARITAYLNDDGTTQVQARMRELKQALMMKRAVNLKEVTNEMAELGNTIQNVGAEINDEV